MSLGSSPRPTVFRKRAPEVYVPGPNERTVTFISGRNNKKATYVLGNYLGAGGWSWVMEAWDITNGVRGQRRAVKFTHKRSDRAKAKHDMKYIKAEVDALDACFLTEDRARKWDSDENHIVQMHDFCYDCKYFRADMNSIEAVVLVLEVVSKGELFDLLYYTRQPFNENIARALFTEMAEGLFYCAQMGVANRDLKPQNMLLTDDFGIKIADYGLSRCVKSPAKPASLRMRTSFCGTPGFQAPQLLRKEEYTIKCDVFSLGVILFIMTAGRPPFGEARKNDYWYGLLWKKKYNDFWRANDDLNFSNDLKDLIQKMLADTEAERLSIDGVLNHAWVQSDEKATKQQVIRTLSEMYRLAKREKAGDPKAAEKKCTKLRQ